MGTTAGEAILSGTPKCYTEEEGETDIEGKLVADFGTAKKHPPTYIVMTQYPVCAM